MVGVRVVLIPLQVIPLNQGFYPLLQIGWLVKRKKWEKSSVGWKIQITTKDAIPRCITRNPSLLHLPVIPLSNGQKPHNKKTHLHLELELFKQLRNEEIVSQLLSHLHDSYDGSVDLILSILEDSFLTGGLFFLLLIFPFPTTWCYLFQMDQQENKQSNLVTGSWQDKRGREDKICVRNFRKKAQHKQIFWQ